MRRALLACLLAAPAVAMAANSARTHQDWRREAAAAYARHDYPGFLAATEAALALRTDSPRYLFNLADALVLNRRNDEALATLRRLADLGVVLPIADAPDLAPLRDTPAFHEVVQTMTANARPQGAGTTILELAAVPGIIEGVAYRAATREYFFGDVRQRCVWRRSADGKLARFSTEEAGLLGVFNVTVDEARGFLWLTTSALPEIAGYTTSLKGHGALCALDLKTGSVVRRYPLPIDSRDHCLGDLLLAPDGTIYVTDSFAPVIWRLTPSGTQLEPFIESPLFSSLQGLALVDHERRLVVSDYPNGLWLVDLPQGRINAVVPPPHATLLGIDGLLSDGTRVIAVQNGIEPQRVVRLTFSSDFTSVTRTEILAAALPGFDDLTLPLWIDGQPHVISQSGWAGFDHPQANPPPHPVRLVRVGAPLPETK